MPSGTSEIVVDLPRKLRGLWDPHRYKVAYGGRGSAKSWSFARALLVMGAMRPLRIGCFREVQKSIADSVHKLLCDQVELLGLAGFYSQLQYRIHAPNGTEFLFSGLSDQTAHSIKSFEGLDIAWVEEGQAVTRRSWDILLPTVRKAGSEIWVGYNPELETDATHQLFVINQPDDALVVPMNWQDNPWFNDVLEAERQRTLKTDPKGYANIWEGQCRPAVEGAIFYDEIAAAEREGRVDLVPHDPRLKTHAVWDLGFNDSMAIAMVQRHESSIRVIDYLEDNRKTYDWYAARLREKPYRWGDLWLPHDGENENAFTGKSAQATLQALGFSVRITPNLAVEEGIRAARQTFGQIFFNKATTGRLIECCKRYRRDVSLKTGAEGRPRHDEFSHGGDVMRYLSIAAPQMTNDDWGKDLKYPDLNVA